MEDVVSKWNSRWQYDFWWRTKYNIPFGSQAHREASQIDIYFEYVESNMYQAAMDRLKKDEERQKKLKDGIWINDNVDVTDDMWDKLSIDALAKSKLNK